MEKKLLQEALHYNMAVVGGIFGGYAVLDWFDNLGSAATSNLIHFVIALVGGNLEEAVIRLGGVGLYFFGAALTVLITRKTKLNVKFISLAISLVAAFICGILPETTNRIIALYPIFFAMSVQWCSFKGVYGFACSTIFSTNNLKQTAIGITDYLCTKDEGQLLRARFFGTTLIFFHIGVVICYLLWVNIGIHCIWIAALPLLSGGALTYIEGKQDKKS